MQKLKRIGVITFQKSSHSYGAALQAFATYKFLHDNNYVVELIDLCTEDRFTMRLGKKYKMFSSKFHFKILKGLILDYIFHPLRHYRFYKFNARSSYSRTYNSIDDLYKKPPIYDVYCTGSDQSLNPLLTRVPDPYLLTFASQNAKRISYASSIGNLDISENFHNLYKTELKKYSHISVREESAKIIIEKLTKRTDIVVSLDPTMLIDSEYYKDIAISKKRKDYIFCYFLNYKKENLLFAKSVAEFNKLDLVVCGTKYKGLNAIFLSELGPLEWLGLIKEAKHIITDSFHGTIFSMLINGNFSTCIFNEERSSRIRTLFDHFDLNSHIISSFDEPYLIKTKSMNINTFKMKLNTLKNTSSEYFLHAIEN